MNRYLSSIKRYIWIPLICVLLAAAGGLFVTKSQPTAFQATAILFVNAGAPSTTYVGGSTSTDSMGEATNYAAMITSRSFMQTVFKSDPTIQKLGYTADDLLANTLTTPSSTVPSIMVMTTARSSSDAVLLVNDIANTFQAFIAAQNEQGLVTRRNQLQAQLLAYQNQEKQDETQLLQIPSTDPRYPIISSNRDSSIRLIETLQTTLLSLPSTVTGDVSVIQSATASDVVPTTKTTTTLAIISGVGLLVGLLIMLLVIYLDNRLQVDEEVKEKLGLAYLGGVSSDKQIGQDPAHTSDSGIVRDLADIAANLNLTGILPDRQDASQGATLLITSAQEAEGKTSIAVGLAATLARSGYYVVLMDGNLQHPQTHLTLGMNVTGAGLSGLLLSKSSIADAVVRTNIPHLWLLSAGVPMDNAALLLGQKLPALLTELRQKIHLIIIDGPALLTGAEASVLANIADGTVLVIDSRHSKMPMLLRAKQVLHSLGSVHVGVILNHLPRRGNNHYYVSALTESGSAHKNTPIQQAAGSLAKNGSASIPEQKALFSFLKSGEPRSSNTH